MKEDRNDRTRIEEKLKDNEAKFRAVTESAIDSIITIDSSGIITYFNRSMLELFGYSTRELKDKPVSILIPERYRGRFRKGMESFRSGKSQRTGKTTRVLALKKDGTEFPCEISLSSWKSNGETYFTAIIRDLTERKEAEDAIVRAKEEWESTFNAVPDLIAIIDTDFHILRVNKAMADRLGVDPDEAVGTPCYVAVHGLDHPPDFCPMSKLLDDGNEHTSEVHENRIGGDFIVSVSPLYDKSGNLIGSVHVARDINERKKIEEALRESEQKYRAIFENVQDIFFQTDIKGTIIEISPSVERYFGISPENLIGKPVESLYYDPKDREKLLNILQKNGEVADYEIRIKNRTNKWTYISANVHMIYDDNNRPTGIEGALRDITDRKNAEEAIKSQYHFLERLINTIPYPLFYKDINYVYMGCNKSFEEYIGLSKDKIVGKTVYDVAPKDLADKYHEMDKELIENGQTQIYEADVKYADGTRHNVIFNKSTFSDSDGYLAGLIGVMVDITQRKLAEEKLKESLDEKEMLLKEIHHRVKNNLMVISSLLNLQSQYIKDEEALDIFKESQNRAKSMALIHERLYRSTDLKKIDFGDYIRTLSNDLFHTYITDPTRVDLKMKVENLRIDINTIVPLGLIVNELVTNSLKHGFPEGIKGELNIDFYKEDDDFVLVIGDTGVGLPEDLDWKNTDSLGLQLVNNLVMQIDGTITLDRSHGTEFKIRFKEMEI